MLDNEDANDALFALHSGDVVNDDWNDTEWGLTLDAVIPLNNEMPHLFVTGNHDNDNFQHYSVVDVASDSVTYKVYQVAGEDLANRETTLVHTYEITK